MLWSAWWVWIVAGVVLGVVEIVLPGYVFLGFALGAMAVGLLTLIGLLGTSLPVMLLVFALLSLAAWAGLRAVFPYQRGKVTVIRHDINDN